MHGIRIMARRAALLIEGISWFSLVSVDNAGIVKQSRYRPRVAQRIPGS